MGRPQIRKQHDIFKAPSGYWVDKRLCRTRAEAETGKGL